MFSRMPFKQVKKFWPSVLRFLMIKLGLFSNAASLAAAWKCNICDSNVNGRFLEIGKCKANAS